VAAGERWATVVACAAASALVGGTVIGAIGGPERARSAVERPVAADPPAGTNPPATTTTAAWAQPASAAPPPAAPPRPGRTVVVGDSLTATTLNPVTPGPRAPADLQVITGIGWQVGNAQPGLDAALAAGPVDTLVIALGTNDANPNNAGWTDADVEAFRHMIGSVGDATCVVIVLPGYGANAHAGHAAQIDQAQVDLRFLADERDQGVWYGPTVVVDWEERIARDPGALAGDGIHLQPWAGTAWALPGPAQARTDAYWDGVDACQAAPPGP
jgi:hypothetical protein